MVEDHLQSYFKIGDPHQLTGVKVVVEARVDHSKALVCTTCGWGFFCFEAIYLQGLN